MMQQVRALTFDLDDTLWDNRPVMLAAEQTLYDWLARHYPLVTERHTLDDLRNLRVQLAQQRPELRHHMTALRKQSLQQVAESVGYDGRMVEPAFAHFLEARQKVKPYDDVRPALQRLRGAGYLIGALTNGNADVRRTSIGRLFHFSLSAESVGRPKPHPRMFEEACRCACVTPTQLAHVGDEPATDLAGAQAAGVKVIWMNRLRQTADPRFGHHAEVRGMDELLGLFGLRATDPAK